MRVGEGVIKHEHSSNEGVGSGIVGFARSFDMWALGS